MSENNNNNDNSDLYLLTIFLQGSFTSAILTKTNYLKSDKNVRSAHVLARN